MRRGSATALCVLFGACTILKEEVDTPTGWQDGMFEEGTTAYGEVLRAFGPPATVSAYGDGFAFLYEYMVIHERQLGISYDEEQFGFNVQPLEIIKFAYGKGWADRQSLVLTFDGAGTLQAEEFNAWREDLGTGASVQFILDAGSVVDTSRLRNEPEVNRWGMQMLRTLPETLNTAQSLDTGQSGLELRGTTHAVGQRTLEMDPDHTNENPITSVLPFP